MIFATGLMGSASTFTAGSSLKRRPSGMRLGSLLGLYPSERFAGQEKTDDFSASTIAMPMTWRITPLFSSCTAIWPGATGGPVAALPYRGGQMPGFFDTQDTLPPQQACHCPLTWRARQ